MKKRILKFAAVLVLVVIALCGCEAASGYPKATERFFVNDFADVLETADEDTMYNMAVSLNNSTTAQVVVVTVESLDGKEPYEYALELGREWGVGTEENNNGIVILLSGKEYLGCVPSLRILMLALFISFFAGFINNMIIITSGRDKLCLLEMT